MPDHGAFSGSRVRNASGVAGPLVHWIHGARLLIPSSSLSNRIPLVASRSAMVHLAASGTWIPGRGREVVGVIGARPVELAVADYDTAGIGDETLVFGHGVAAP